MRFRIAGLPIIVSGFVPGQEEGDVHYVLKHEASVYAPITWWHLPAKALLCIM
jgi:hypothetical protein